MNRYWGNDFFDMMNFGSRAGVWFLIYNAVKFIIIIVLIILLARLLIKNSKNNNTFTSNKAIEILKERYARGEIDEEEYNAKFKNIKRD